jgi:hypothetical protein
LNQLSMKSSLAKDKEVQTLQRGTPGPSSVSPGQVCWRCSRPLSRRSAFAAHEAS